MYHDTRIGEAMPFPLFTCADDARVRITSSAQSCVESATNRQRGEGIPWMLLGPHNMCVSAMKHTKKKRHIQDHHYHNCE